MAENTLELLNCACYVKDVSLSAAYSSVDVSLHKIL